MSDFYTELVRWYDLLFSEEEEITDFLLSGLTVPSSLLDLGCGTGTYAAALAREGHHVTAVDPSPEMIERAQQRGAGIRAVAGTLTSFPTASYDLIYCIGNTLPHLSSFQEVRSSLAMIAEALRDGGELLIQTVNFDRDPRTLPPIRRPGLTMERWYEPENGGDHVRFCARIVEEDATHEYATRLLRVRSGRLVELVTEAGLEAVTLDGDFRRSPHRAESFLTVLRARRRG